MKKEDFQGLRVKTIPEPIEHIDCPRCTNPSSIKQIVATGKTTSPYCKVCGGEGVVRKDGEPTLKTRLEYSAGMRIRS